MDLLENDLPGFTIESATKKLQQTTFSKFAPALRNQQTIHIRRKPYFTPRKSRKVLVSTSSAAVVICDLGLFLKDSEKYNAHAIKFCCYSLAGKLEPPSCMSQCSCRSDQFLPICGSDGMNYYSPCHAGCSEGNITVSLKNTN